jgi:hypothetical protein
VLVTRNDGTQYVQEVENDLGVGGKDKKGLQGRLQAQGVDGANIELFGSGEDKGGNFGKPPTSSAPASASMGAKGVKGRKKKGKKGTPGMHTVTPARVEPTPGLKLIIAKIKSEMKSRGSGGFIGLQRRFRIMDDDGSKSLDIGEFKKAMREFNMDLSEADLRTLFEYFDADGSGTIDFEEFVQVKTLFIYAIFYINPSLSMLYIKTLFIYTMDTY